MLHWILAIAIWLVVVGTICMIAGYILHHSINFACDKINQFLQYVLDKEENRLAMENEKAELAEKISVLQATEDWHKSPEGLKAAADIATAEANYAAAKKKIGM